MRKGLRGVGDSGESRAADFLRGLGYEIIAANFHARVGEIDLLCRDGGEFVFVEVKYRAGDRFGSAIEAVTPRKIRAMQAAAAAWLEKENQLDSDWRLDAVAIDGSEIRHEKNIGLE